MPIRICILLISFLFCIPIVCGAEKIEDEQQDKVLFPSARNIDQEHQKKIMFARRLLAQKNYEGAANFLEVMYEDKPNDQVVLNLLKQCYSRLKLYFKLEELLKKQIALQPKNIGFWLSLAELSAKQGRSEDAISYYKKAISYIDGINRVRFQLVVQSMINYSLESEAEKNILEWRRLSEDNSLLGDQMGLIYEQKKEYKNALEEYYPMLDDTTRIGNKVEKEIVELLLFEDSAPITEKFLLERSEKDSNIRVIKILAMHYIRTRQFDKSFAFTKLRDSLSDKTGSALYSYMQTCKREKLFDELIRMGEYLLSQYDKTAIGVRTRFLMADAYANSGMLEKSITTYNLIFDSTKIGREKADVLYSIAEIYRDKLYDIDSALIYLDSVAIYYKSGLNYMNARVEIPYCYVLKGDLGRAKELYLKLEKLRMNVDVKEKVLYQLAQTLFLDKNVDSCKTLLSKLLLNFPKGFYVNDALSLLKIIQTGEDAPHVLDYYGSALLLVMQHQNDSAIKMFDKIALDDSKVLADFALYTIINMKVSQPDFVSALVCIDQMEASFPESYYLPFSLKQKADIYNQNKKADEAYKIYRHLLKEFPNYPFISEVREILRSIPEPNS